MRLLGGGNMATLLKNAPPDPVKALGILRRVAEALDYAHARGVVHRDIKPANILFDRDGRACVGDFGLAQMLEGNPVVTRTGMVVGTPHYMAPEQALGNGVDHRCDVYSLGIVAYEMLFGRTPFTGDSPVAVLLKHVNDPLPVPAGSRLPEPAAEGHPEGRGEGPRRSDGLRPAHSPRRSTPVSASLEVDDRRPSCRLRADWRALAAKAPTAHHRSGRGARYGRACVGPRHADLAPAASPRHIRRRRLATRLTIQEPQPARGGDGLRDAPSTPVRRSRRGTTPDAAAIDRQHRRAPVRPRRRVHRPQTAITAESRTPETVRPSQPTRTGTARTPVSTDGRQRRSADLTAPERRQPDIRGTSRRDDAGRQRRRARRRSVPPPAACRSCPRRRIRTVHPAYPAWRVAAQLEGNVVLDVTVGADGTVGNVVVVKSRRTPCWMTRPGRRSMRSTYSPGRRNGVPEASTHSGDGRLPAALLPP